MEFQWDLQQKIDDEAYKLYRKKQPLDVAEPRRDAEKIPVRPLRTGLAGRLIDQDVSILAQTPTFRVNTPPNKRDVYRLEIHASNTLEPWLNGAFDQSQVEEVWLQQIRDLRLYGRGWSNLFVLPRLWADDEFKELVAKYLRAISSHNEDHIATAQEAIEDFKRDNFPIRWQYADARATWPQISTERRLPEIVELREMTIGDIAADYSASALPEGADPDDHNQSSLRVFVYTNWVWTATLVEHSKTLAHKWKHNLGMNPYILMETNIQPKGSMVRWKSALYDHADMFEAEDEVLSDLRHNHRRNTLAGHLFTLDPILRSTESPDVMAHPEKLMEYSPGDDISLWKGENVGLLPAPMVNPQSLTYLEFINTLIQSIALNPVEAGRILSGVSAVGFTTALQAAQRRLDPFSNAIIRAAKDWAKLAFRSVARFSTEFPDAPDTIYVTRAKGGAVGVTPHDVEGWESLIQPKLSSMLPINENAMMSLAAAAQNLQIPPQYVLEHYLNIENPEDIIDGWERWKIREALLADKIQKTLMLAGELAQTMPETNAGDLAARIANLPPAAQLGIQMGGGPGGSPAGPGTQPGSLGALEQGMSNQRRAGTPQQPSETVATEIAPQGIV